MKIASFLVGLVAGTALTAFFGAVALYVDATQTAVRIHNSSASALTRVEIALASRTIWSGDIAPAETVYVQGEPPGDGELHVRFTQDGEEVSESFGYVTSGPAGDLHMLDILDGADVRRVTCPKPLSLLMQAANH